MKVAQFLVKTAYRTNGTRWDQIGGDRTKQSVEELSLFTRLAVSGIDSICEMVEAVQRAFEGDSLQVDIVGQGSSLHQGANEIVSDPMHRPLFENHPWGEAAQDIHAKHGFDAVGNTARRSSAGNSNRRLVC